MTAPGSELATRDGLNLSPQLTTAGWKPQTLDDLRQICSWIAKSRIAPRGFDTPEKVFIGLQTAMEAGLPMLSGLRMLYVVHSTPSWMGKGALALIRSKGVCDIPPQVRFEGKGVERRAIWHFKRKDMPKAIDVEYTWRDAMTAGLDKKEGPWQTNPDDMLSWRAVGRMGDQYFSDVLAGLEVYEVVRDYPPEAFDEAGAAERASAEPPTVEDPLMVGSGEPAQPGGPQTPMAVPADAPGPTTSARNGPAAVEPPILIACPYCGGQDAYSQQGPWDCTNQCGHMDVRKPVEQDAPEAAGSTESVAPVTDTNLRKMLSRVGVNVTARTVESWTVEQATAAYNWAYDEQNVIDAAEADVEYERAVPTRPEFLPAPKVAGKRKAPSQPAAPAAPEPQEPSEPSPYSTPGGSCITTRQAGALRGLALSRCGELGLTAVDARFTLLDQTLGCKTEEVTEDMYEAAKTAVKAYEPGL